VLSASTLVHGGTPRFLVQGTEAAYSVDGLDAQEGWLKAGSRPDRDDWGLEARCAALYRSQNDQAVLESLPLPQGDYAAYYAAIRDAILGRGENPVSGREAREVMWLLDLARQSAAEGRRVAVI
jgi:scyllo-inositol 2-dehydrogenase (NADP+)